jgi:hypothetical protein
VVPLEQFLFGPQAFTRGHVLHARVVVPGERPLVFRRVEPDDRVPLVVVDVRRVVDVQLVVAEDALLRRRLGSDLEWILGISFSDEKFTNIFMFTNASSSQNNAE